MGDDVVDLPVMMSVGIGCSPSDAAEEVRQRSDLVTGAPGGNGAARELIFIILQAQGLLEGLIARYIPS
jgi:3-deoxy-D-manno-octulosonate 8-phosphate phosphatase (KDO 8-P phosphatase)